METPPPPTNAPKIDITKEINRLAEMDGLKHPAQLDLKIEMTRREQYTNILQAYYLGRDDGVTQIHGPILQRAMVRCFVAGSLLGLLLGGVTVVVLINQFAK